MAESVLLRPLGEREDVKASPGLKSQPFRQNSPRKGVHMKKKDILAPKLPPYKMPDTPYDQCVRISDPKAKGRAVFPPYKEKKDANVHGR